MLNTVRLKQLRLARGFSLEGLASAMGNVVTKQALSKYETGRAQPTATVLVALARALAVKALVLAEESRWAVEPLGFRKLASTGKKDQAAHEAWLAGELETSLRLQALAEPVSAVQFPDRSYRVEHLDDAEAAAEQLRARWQLGTGPLPSIVEILEEHGIHVLFRDADRSFDGLSAIARDHDGQVVGAAAVVRSEVCGDRQRFSLANELGHLVLNVAEGVSEENACHRFAGAFLAPAAWLRREVGTKRQWVSADELKLVKRTLGLSLQALLLRFKELGILSKAVFEQWWAEIDALGWRVIEPEPVAAETSTWRERRARRALAEGLITSAEAARYLKGEGAAEASAEHLQRQALLKMPVGARRRLLEAQARLAARHYETDPEWKETLDGDLDDGE